MAKRHGTLESMGMISFGDCFRGRRVMVTGHTGFKGSWLCLWLKQLGADVCGIALDPDTAPNHFDLLELEIRDHRLDIRDLEALRKIFDEFRPEMVFHLAAQPLVRQSYVDPIYNWSTNVMGTANILELCRQSEHVVAVIAVTTDKVYQNKEMPQGYREEDRLGGHDPYSASKAACELLIESYRLSFLSEPDSPQLASARAGNVIGGGDWSADRLIPDLVRALDRSEQLLIRSPQATRPWQHVLDCLSGYLLLGQNLLADETGFARAWNFGPEEESNKTVAELLESMRHHWSELEWVTDDEFHPHETGLLSLDPSRARAELGWTPVWQFDQSVASTAKWYRDYCKDGVIGSEHQLLRFNEAALESGACWAVQ